MIYEWEIKRIGDQIRDIIHHQKLIESWDDEKIILHREFIIDGYKKCLRGLECDISHLAFTMYQDCKKKSEESDSNG